MLGATDSLVDRERDEDADIQLQSYRGLLANPIMLRSARVEIVPFEETIEQFRNRTILPRDKFDKLVGAAKRKAFTVAGLASEELLGTVHEELSRQVAESAEKTFYDEATGKWVYKGPNLREFRKTMRARIEKAGWTPSNPSHVETIYRTNMAGAYSTGGLVEKTQPAVLKSRPYWQIRGTGDSRQRETHRRAQNTILSADHPFWRLAYPPFGYNCRCRVIARSKRWVDAHGGPTLVPSGLPDPGFDSGIDASMIPDLQVDMQGARAPTAPKEAHKIERTKPKLPPPTRPVPSPQPAPTIPAPRPTIKPSPARTAPDIMAEQLEGPGGSNPGGVYLGSDGKKRYVKLYSDPAQSAGEHLANRLYADLGMGKVRSQLFEHQGKLAYASEFIEGASPLGQVELTPAIARKAMDGLVGDLVTANWDAVGMDLDNLVLTKSGQVIRIDNGGTFLSRAQAGRKPISALEGLSEWDGFFDPNINPSYAKLAQIAGVSGPVDLAPVLKSKLRDLKKIASDAGGWEKYVAKRAPSLPADDAAQIAKMIESRTRLIGEKLKEAEEQAKKLAKAKSTTKAKPRTIEILEPAKLPEEPPQGYPGGVARPDTKEARQAYFDQLHERSRSRVAQVATLEEQDAITTFTEGSTSIRAAMKMTREEWDRSVNRYSDYDTNRRAGERIVAALRKAAASPSTEAVESQVGEMYRGIRDLTKDTFDRMINASDIVWDEPTSTSWHPTCAKYFYTPINASDRNNYSIFYRIKPAKRTKGLGIEGVSSIKDESEVMFGDGVRFRVTKVERDADYERGAIVWVEELP
jgi:SPP1 gp7 family putative phage head morphogenesis protein